MHANDPAVNHILELEDAPPHAMTEIHRFFQMLREIYDALGLSGLEVNLETRPTTGYLGEPADWERAQQALLEGVDDELHPVADLAGQRRRRNRSHRARQMIRSCSICAGLGHGACARHAWM